MYVLLQTFIRAGKFEYSMWPVVYQTRDAVEAALPHIQEKEAWQGYGYTIMRLCPLDAPIDNPPD